MNNLEVEISKENEIKWRKIFLNSTFTWGRDAIQGVNKP